MSEYGRWVVVSAAGILLGVAVWTPLLTGELSLDAYLDPSLLAGALFGWIVLLVTFPMFQE
ncbi:hypothetical protein [Halorussus salinus]|uniref:hypothetical protein n=1 Tax=Halorussus salinus TaxID=1364935 RepID=UPI0010930E75|nr:hypothetical protein [Halorussus salinus]